MKKATIVEIISALFILLFVYTAISKLLAYSNFKGTLGKSPLIAGFAPILSIILPLIELVVSLLLFIPRTRLRGLYGSLALMSLFTLYIAYMLAFTPDLPCSCGGVIRQMSWKQHLLFNSFFLFLSIVGIWLLKTQKMKKDIVDEPPPIIFT